MEKRVAGWGLAVLRVSAGGLMFGFHGAGRAVALWAYLVEGKPWGFINVVAKMGFPAPGLFALAAALTELLAPLLLAAGVLTRPAAALLAVNMAVATCLKVSQGGKEAELPAIYLAVFLVLIVAGPGEFALGGKLRRGK